MTNSIIHIRKEVEKGDRQLFFKKVACPLFSTSQAGESSFLRIDPDQSDPDQKTSYMGKPGHSAAYSDIHHLSEEPQP